MLTRLNVRHRPGRPSRSGAKHSSGGGSSFSGPLDLVWEHLWWAGGPAMTALGLADGAEVLTFPDEVGGLDATQVSATTGRFDVEWAAGNNAPAIELVGGNGLRSAARAVNLPQPFSTVVIGAFSNLAAVKQLIDGRDSTPRVSIGLSSGPLYHGSAPTDESLDSNPYHAVALWSGTSGAVELGGVLQTSQNTGTPQFEGISIGTRYDNSNDALGHVALVGIAAGDVRNQGNWAAYQAWVTATYGIVIE